MILLLEAKIIIHCFIRKFLYLWFSMQKDHTPNEVSQNKSD